MRRISILLISVFAALLNFSCANVKSSLSRSDGSGARNYSSQTDVSRTSSRNDSVAVTRSSGDVRPADNKTYVAPLSNTDNRKSSISDQGGKAEHNQQLINQYGEMDKLGDLVLYELDITERRKDSLLDRFKNASSNERENITQELNKLDSNQLSLYKAYVRVYKDGKTDWPGTRKQVEDLLFNIRGIGNK
jgi:outer membrane lipopolysaccharide assembly protein LptE/RlpB